MFGFWVANEVSGAWEVLKKLRGGVALRCDKLSWHGGHGDMIREQNCGAPRSEPKFSEGKDFPSEKK